MIFLCVSHDASCGVCLDPPEQNLSQLKVYVQFMSYQTFTCEISISQVHGFDRWYIWLVSIVGHQLISVNQASDVTSGRRPAHLGTEAVQALHWGGRWYRPRYWRERRRQNELRMRRKILCGSIRNHQEITSGKTCKKKVSHKSR